MIYRYDEIFNDVEKEVYLGMDLQGDGKWVKYDDHIKVLREISDKLIKECILMEHTIIDKEMMTGMGDIADEFDKHMPKETANNKKD